MQVKIETLIMTLKLQSSNQNLYINLTPRVLGIFIKVHHAIASNLALTVVKIQVFFIVKPILSFCICHCTVEPMCKKVTWSKTLLMSDIN